MDGPNKSGSGGALMAVSAWFRGLGLDVPTVLMMIKGALPPTIVLSMYQADSIAKILGTLGYLTAIVSIFSLAMMPRARYLQGLLINVLAAGAGCAIGQLIIFTTIKARQHSTAAAKAGAAAAASLASVPYNSTASVVAAVWLFPAIYFINVLKYKAPQAQTGTILLSLMLIISCVNAPLLPTVAIGRNFTASIVKAVYMGLGVATGVALFFVPVSSRTVVEKELAGVLGALKRCFVAQQDMMRSLQSEDAVADMLTTGKADRAEVAGVRNALSQLTLLNSKLQVDLPFAKQEVGIGGLNGHELKSVNQLLRLAMLPTVGLGSTIDIFHHFAALRRWSAAELDNMNDEEKALRAKAIKEWVENLRLVRERRDDLLDVVKDAITHVQIQLGLGEKKLPQTDVENGATSKSETPAPGSPGFAAYFEQKVKAFNTNKHLTLIEWGKQHGIQMDESFFDSPGSTKLDFLNDADPEGQSRRQMNQRQLYLLLFMEFLHYSIATALVNLVVYADSLAASGKLTKWRIILPRWKRIIRFFTNVYSTRDLSQDTGTIDDFQNGSHKIYLGESYYAKKDPEHLPPRNWFEAAGDGLLMVPKWLASPASAFGLRAACATMSLALPLFIRQTQAFSAQNRLYWAIIMTAISMSPTSGQSIFGLVLRALGTIAAMLLSWIIYYVAGNGKTPGILVLYWFVVSVVLYIPIKRPAFAAVGMITVVTITLTIGYELEARKIGTIAVSSSGAKYIGILTFGPVRLGTVLAGLFTAFFWTIFPYPISDHSVLRRDAGGSLYLLANYYSVVHATLSARMRRDEGNLADKASVGSRLQKVRVKLYNKQVLLLNDMTVYSRFVGWEPPIGGRFPKKQYDDIVERVRNITNDMSLISYASQTYGNEAPGEGSEWSNAFRLLVNSIDPVSHEIVMILTILSSAIREGRPLPPYMPRPQPFSLSQRLESLDPRILSVRHINEPGYAAFAVLQLAARCIGGDLENLIESVKELVGAMDFSFRVETDASDDGEPSDVPETRKDK